MITLCVILKGSNSDQSLKSLNYSFKEVTRNAIGCGNNCYTCKSKIFLKMTCIQKESICHLCLFPPFLPKAGFRGTLYVGVTCGVIYSSYVSPL